jgi:hypothetical protein
MGVLHANAGTPDQGEPLPDPVCVATVGQLGAVVQPLPDLGSRGSRRLQRPPSGGRSPPRHCRPARHPDIPGRHVRWPATRLGHVADRSFDGKKVGCGDIDIVTSSLQLVGTRVQHVVEDLAADRHKIRMGHPRTVETVLCLPFLVRADLLKRTSVAAASRRSGTNAAMPPIACAPRR